MGSTSLDYTLPDTLANWPWLRQLSNVYSEVKDESTTWVESYQPLDQNGLFRLARNDFALLACLTYSPCNRDIIRLGVDMMNLWYIFSDHVSQSTLEDANNLREIVMDALRNRSLPRTAGEVCIGAMAKDLLNRAVSLCGKPNHPSIDKFLREADLYTAAIISHHALCLQPETHLRPQRLTSLEDYFDVKRPLSGLSLAFCLVEFGLGLKEEVLKNEVLQGLVSSAIDLVILNTDLNSYGQARARCGISQQYNAVTVIMNTHTLPIQGALSWLSVYTRKVISAHLSQMSRVPSWNVRGPGLTPPEGTDDVDQRVGVYLNVLGQWVRGNDDWSFESRRYFGEMSEEFKQTREIRYKSREFEHAGHLWNH